MTLPNQPGPAAPQHNSGAQQPVFTPPPASGPGQQPQAGQQPAQAQPPAQQGGQQQGGGQQGSGSTAGQPQSTGQWRIEDLPEGARNYITQLRGEAAENRTGKTSAEQQLQQLLGVLQQATGQSAAVPPEQLANQLAEEKRRSREKDVELAVLRVAGQHGGDPAALLDSRGFLDRVHGLDPATQTFATAIAQEIQNAVQANPRLAAVAPAQTPATAPGGRAMGQGRASSQPGLTGTAAGRALRQERKKARGGPTTT